MNKAEKISYLSEKLGYEFPDMTVAQLDPIVDALKEKEALALASAEKDNLIKELNEALSAAETGNQHIRTKNPIRKVGGKTYEIIGSARIKGERYTREEISKSADLVEELIKIGSGVVRPV